MSWRLAKSLATLRDQVNASAPGRSKENDGTIGDTAHQATISDHNANSAGVVTAIDFTHSPNEGFDAGRFAEVLRKNRDPRIKYVIFNGRIFNSTVSPWIWRDRNKGPGDHSEHVHVSVSTDPTRYDDDTPWNLESVPTAAAPGKRQTNIIATVWTDAMGAYGLIDHSEPCVSLPAAFPRDALPFVRVFGPKGSAIGRVVDKGPWYDGTSVRPADCYWETGRRPRAESDPVTNGAGIDLNPVMAERIGLPGSGAIRKGLVDWEFVDAQQQPVEPSMPEPSPINPPPLKIPPVAPYADELAELVAQKLQAKLAQPETKASMTAMLSTLFSGLVSQSPLLGVGLLLAQQLLASGGLVGTMAGSTATTTGQNVGSTGIAVIAAGVLNWVRQALTRKPGTPS